MCKTLISYKQGENTTRGGERISKSIALTKG